MKKPVMQVSGEDDSVANECQWLLNILQTSDYDQAKWCVDFTYNKRDAVIKTFSGEITKKRHAVNKTFF